MIKKSRALDGFVRLHVWPQLAAEVSCPLQHALAVPQDHGAVAHVAWRHQVLDTS